MDNNYLVGLDVDLDTDNGVVNLAKIDQPMILFFYPKDNTPGCISENIEFTNLYQEFIQLGFLVFGISRDNIDSHCNFKTKYGISYQLIADTEQKLCHIFDVIKEKNMYGKKVKSIERSTFILNKDKNLIHSWRGVKAIGHADTVLNYVKGL